MKALRAPYTDTPNLGVALWLCPKKTTALYDKLQVAMDSLATVFPGQVPRVEPHITTHHQCGSGDGKRPGRCQPDLIGMLYSP